MNVTGGLYRHLKFRVQNMSFYRCVVCAKGSVQVQVLPRLRNLKSFFLERRIITSQPIFKAAGPPLVGCLKELYMPVCRSCVPSPTDLYWLTTEPRPSRAADFKGQQSGQPNEFFGVLLLHFLGDVWKCRIGVVNLQCKASVATALLRDLLCRFE